MKKNFCQIDHHVSYFRQQKFRHDQPLSRLLQTTFAYSKQKAGVAWLCLINRVSVIQNESSASIHENDGSLGGDGFCGCRLVVQNARSPDL